ncbi:unnamed protein product [Leptidea sinapis]|uniref:Uncharacterized protein n=1 Tax=Leptidea sinapis TaxID=189913 RepID=A0A5E4Q773_9NEOP|nr:unnamed protein product [Leptidea sinapis]
MNNGVPVSRLRQPSSTLNTQFGSRIVKIIVLCLDLVPGVNIAESLVITADIIGHQNSQQLRNCQEDSRKSMR